MRLSIQGDELSHAETTSLDIYGRQYEHTDACKLQRVIYDYD